MSWELQPLLGMSACRQIRRSVMSHNCDNRRIERLVEKDSLLSVALANKTRWTALVAIWIMAATFARAGDGNILRQVVNPALAAQRAALANQVQAAQAVQAVQSATQIYQAAGIRGGGVMINVANNPSAVPSQILATVHADGKVYVIDRNGIIFGGPRQINTHELTGAAMGATSNSMSDLAKFQRSVTKPKENPSLMKVDVLGYGGK
jgi:filamentous hemagglutinin family protein